MPNREQFKTQKEYLEWYSIIRERNAEKLREYNRRYNKEWRRDFVIRMKEIQTHDILKKYGQENHYNLLSERNYKKGKL